MPELAEVEYYRRQWDSGLGGRIAAVKAHREKRIFRGTDVLLMEKVLTGATLKSSEARGKKMLFRFSRDAWLGIHLGMTGKLHTGPANFTPDRHDHLVLYERSAALIFTDSRQFGRVTFHQGKETPPWWATGGPEWSSPDFTHKSMRDFIARHGRLPIKAALLLQTGFPGIGNWMADEILWRAGIKPARKAGELEARTTQKLWREVRFVCREAIKNVARDFSDPPPGWLFHERWKRKGNCPIHKKPLIKETIGGRTTAWCPKCQK